MRYHAPDDDIARQTLETVLGAPLQIHLSAPRYLTTCYVPCNLSGKAFQRKLGLTRSWLFDPLIRKLSEITRGELSFKSDGAYFTIVKVKFTLSE